MKETNRKDFNVGDTVRVNPDCISDINYTNKPQVGTDYKITSEWVGDTWTFGLSHLSGKDANIHISWKHLILVSKAMKLLLLLLLSGACHAQTGGELGELPNNASRWFVKYDTSRFRPHSDMAILRIMHEGKEVAYRKKDSAWVFINPEGTVNALELLAKRQMGWQPYEQPISLELPEQYFIPEGDSVKSYPRQYIEDTVLLNIKNDTIYIKYDTIPADLIYRTKYGQTGWVRGWEVVQRVPSGRVLVDYKSKPEYATVYDNKFVTYLQSDRRPFPKGTRVAKVEGVREY